MSSESIEMGNSTVNVQAQRAWPAFNTIWRWHFYAGLFCIPFIIWLSITGALYLFKPQFEAAVESPLDHLVVSGARAAPSAQVAAALAVVPGGVLNAYQLPASQDSAVRVLVGHDTQLMRVYVHPETLQILKVEEEDGRLMRILFHLHGELLLGDQGSMIVELAASWAIVMLITGLYLWWPRNATNLAGILYPRLNRGKHLKWRDLHAVTGFWVVFFALFLLVSGLPWAKSWGGLLKEVRHFSDKVEVQQDWTTGRSSELKERREMNMQMGSMASGEHSTHGSHDGTAMMANDYNALDKLVATVQPLDLAEPALIAPPSKHGPAWGGVSKTDWTARSDAKNRPLRVNLVLDGNTGEIKSRKNFSDKLLLDRIIGIGVAAHEGQLFGWLNQALGVFTGLGLVLMSVSGIVLWWKRKFPGRIGAPKASEGAVKIAYSLIALIVVLGVVLPMLGISLLIVLMLERLVLRRFHVTRAYLGLVQPAA